MPETIRQSPLHDLLQTAPPPGGAIQAERLRSEANTIGEAASDDERRRLSDVFREALVLEIDFHTAPYAVKDS